MKSSVSLLFPLFISLELMGCATGIAINKTDQKDRLSVVSVLDSVYLDPESKKPLSNKSMVCMEPTGSVTSVKGLNVNVGASNNMIKGEIGVEATEQIAKIYQVSEIMQLGHAAMYRLCEARLNGFITNKEYLESLNNTLAQVNILLQTQMQDSKEIEIARLGKEIDKSEKRIAELDSLQKELKNLKEANMSKEGAQEQVKSIASKMNMNTENTIDEKTFEQLFNQIEKNRTNEKNKIMKYDSTINGYLDSFNK